MNILMKLWVKYHYNDSKRFDGKTYQEESKNILKLNGKEVDHSVVTSLEFKEGYGVIIKHPGKGGATKRSRAWNATILSELVTKVRNRQAACEMGPSSKQVTVNQQQKEWKRPSSKKKSCNVLCVCIFSIQLATGVSMYKYSISYVRQGCGKGGPSLCIN